MAELSLDLHVIDVDGRPIVDPTVFVRVSGKADPITATMKVALNGAPRPLRFENGPSGFSVALRVTPSRYMDGAVFCTVDGDGMVTPMRPLRLPRRSSEWRPAFTPWQRLPRYVARLPAWPDLQSGAARRRTLRQRRSRR
jgi:hypothetical protein